MISPSQTFDELLAASDLPPPGPELYAARRKLWLAPRSTMQSHTPVPSTAHRRLEKLLSTPNAVENDKVWNNGIEKVWKGLAAGANLKRRLPMALMVNPIILIFCIVQACRKDQGCTCRMGSRPDLAGGSYRTRA